MILGVPESCGAGLIGVGVIGDRRGGFRARQWLLGLPDAFGLALVVGLVLLVQLSISLGKRVSIFCDDDPPRCLWLLSASFGSGVRRERSRQKGKPTMSPASRPSNAIPRLRRADVFSSRSFRALADRESHSLTFAEFIKTNSIQV